MQYKLFENSLNDRDNIIETVLFNRGIENPQEYLNLDKSCTNNYNNSHITNKMYYFAYIFIITFKLSQ